MAGRGGRYPKGAARRAELLRTTLAVVERLGDAEASMRTIAREADISLAGLLHYFPTRDALMFAVLEMMDEDSILRYEAALERGETLDPAELITAVLEQSVAKPVLALTYFSIVAASNKPGHPAAAYLAKRYETFRTAIVNYIESEQAAGRVPHKVDATFAASSLLAATDGIQVQWMHDRSIDIVGHVERTWEMLLMRHAAAAAGSVATSDREGSRMQ